MGDPIPFNRPRLVGREHEYIDEALATGKVSGNGRFAHRCADLLEARVGGRALITPSCTAALEMAGILAGISAGDEVIVPSFTFVSTANAFALLGGVPVFVDVDPETLNVDPTAVEMAVTDRTRAVVAVHYAGVACDMEHLLDVANRHDLVLIEDAAHALPAEWKHRALGSLGHLATFSFHETKNVHCGEGGALVVNDPALVERAEIVQEKGTDRSRFFRGEVDKYTWQDIGSSYLISEVSAAFLCAQLEEVEDITDERRNIWNAYDEGLAHGESAGFFRRPIVPSDRTHSGHLYYLLMPSRADRDRLIADLGESGIGAVFHYVPLHASPAGNRLGRTCGQIVHAPDVSERLVRLPIWSGLGEARVERVLAAVLSSVERTVDPSLS